MKGERKMETLFGIQYLRAFAALAVVVFHAAERNGQHFAIGAAGVDVFFVVSGFIMMAISDRLPVTPAVFLRDRLLRIAPSYWIVTTVMVLGAAAGLFPNLRLDLGHILGSYLFIPVASPSTGQLWPVLVQGWTLNYEMFFYLVFAAALFLPSRWRLAALAGTLCSVVLLRSALSAGEPGPAAFYTRPLIMEFAAGALLAKLWKHGALPPPLVGGALMVAAIAGFGAIHGFGLPFDERLCGPLAVMLVLGMLSIEVGGRLPRLPAVAYLGNSSYSIYLWHTLAISVVTKAGILLSFPPLLTAATGAVAGTILGCLAYEAVEKPLQALLKRRRPLPQSLPVGTTP
ncbi:acyltransferase [Pseudomonas sp. R2.Fl]|nr:acyltransferase [Pseudomonas sp. R2.Fl]